MDLTHYQARVEARLKLLTLSYRRRQQFYRSPVVNPAGNYPYVVFNGGFKQFEKTVLAIAAAFLHKFLQRTEVSDIQVAPELFGGQTLGGKLTA